MPSYTIRLSLNQIFKRQAQNHILGPNVITAQEKVRKACISKFKNNMFNGEKCAGRLLKACDTEEEEQVGPPQ